MQTKSNTHRSRTVIAAVTFALFVAVSTSACASSLWSVTPLPRMYACSYTSQPTQGQTLSAVAVATYNRQGQGVDDWKALIRERSHYIGADTAVLDPNLTLVIPRICEEGEQSGSVSSDVPAS